MSFPLSPRLQCDPHEDPKAQVLAPNLSTLEPHPPQYPKHILGCSHTTHANRLPCAMQLGRAFSGFHVELCVNLGSEDLSLVMSN